MICIPSKMKDEYNKLHEGHNSTNVFVSHTCSAVSTTGASEGGGP